MKSIKVKHVVALTVAAASMGSFAQSNFDLAPPNEAVLSQAEGLFRVPPSPAIIQKLFPTITIDPYQEGFERRAEFGVGLTWIVDDNGYRDGDEVIDNNQIALTPYYTYQSKLNGEHPYQFNATASLLQNDEVDEDNITKLNINGGITLNPASSLRTGLELGYINSTLARGQAGARVQVDEQDQAEDEYNNFNGKVQVTFGRDTDRLSASLMARISDNDFTNNDRDVADNTRIEYGAGVFYAIDPVNVVSLEILLSEYDFPVGHLDGSATGWQLGYAWEPSDNLALNAHVGTTNREFDELNFGETGDITEYAGSLVYRPSEASNISFYMANTIDDADATTDVLSNVQDQDGYFEASLIGISGGTLLTDRIRVGGSYNIQDADYRRGRSDTTTDYGGFLGYLVTDYLTIGAMIGNSDRESNGEEADYDNGYYGLYARTNFVQ